jgi:hypothetical protein
VGKRPDSGVAGEVKCLPGYLAFARPYIVVEHMSKQRKDHP